jgi:DNA-binding SARP family transcriptional activator/TolB-like protein
VSAACVFEKIFDFSQKKPVIRLRLLGSVELNGSNGEELRGIIAQPKPMALLAYLAAATPAGYRRREELLSIFWPELDSGRGRRALSQALHVLRSDLDEGVISARGVEELGLDRSLITSDVDAFREAIGRRDWKGALDSYHGELLAGFLISGSPEFDQWLDRERSRLKSQATEAAWHLADETSDVKAARRAVELDPYSEEGIRRLIKFFDKTGNRAEAIRAYDEFRARMARDLESEPSKETRALAESLRESPAPRKKSAVTVEYAAHDQKVDAPPPQPESAQQPKRSRRRMLLLAGVAALGVIAALVFARGRPMYGDAPKFTPTRLVIAEFESAPGDTALGRTITEAMRLDLSRSNLVKVMSDATVRDALVLMKRDTMLRVSADIAREVALRENIPAILAGDVRRAGNGFLLSARLVNATSGDLLNGWRATANDSAGLLAAIDNLSASVRKEAGESARTIRVTSPLVHVSTSSLAALRKEAMAQDAFFAEDFPRAVSLLRDAIAEDSTFADAHLLLSVIAFNSWTHPSVAVDAAINAYKYRDKLRDAERYNVMFQYLSAVKGDIPAAIDAEKNVLAIDPQIAFHGRYSGLLAQQRRFRDAELAALQGLQWETNPFLYAFLAIARFRAGHMNEARRTVAYGLEKFPRSPILLGLRAEITAATGQYARADSIAHADTPDNLAALAALDAVTGKIGEARTHLAELRRNNESKGLHYIAVTSAVNHARFELEVAHDTARALSIVDSIPASKDWQALFPNERPYGPIAHFYVLAGKFDRAQSAIAGLERDVPPDYRAREQFVVKRTRAMLRAVAGDLSGIDDLKSEYRTDPQPTAALADLVWLYRRLGRTADAATAAQAYLDELFPRRAEDDGFNLSAMRQLVAR